MGNINVVGPNECLVITGDCCKKENTTYIVGGWGWSWWFVSKVQRLSLEAISLNPFCEGVLTEDGVPVSVRCSAQVKVFTEACLLKMACDTFLGKSVEHIRNTTQECLEGNLRKIIGRVNMATLFEDRELFSEHVRETAAPDLGRMGMEILTFLTMEVDDKGRYLSSVREHEAASDVKEDVNGEETSPDVNADTDILIDVKGD